MLELLTITADLTFRLHGFAISRSICISYSSGK